MIETGDKVRIYRSGEYFLLVGEVVSISGQAIVVRLNRNCEHVYLDVAEVGKL